MANDVFFPRVPVHRVTARMVAPIGEMASKSFPGDQMTADCKRADELTPEDLTKFPVWEFALDLEEVDDLAMRPVEALPVRDLGNRIVGAQVRLANGNKIWAGLGNIFPNDPQKTKRALVVSFYIGGQWIPLSREMNVEMYGPDALASRLGLKVEDVFPATYDVSAVCVGDRDATRGSIEAVPPKAPPTAPTPQCGP